MIKAAIFGASGYTGQELTRILLGHPEVKLVAVTSRRFAGQPVTDVFPSLYGLTSLKYQNATPAQISNICDIVFSGSSPWGFYGYCPEIYQGRQESN